MRVRRPSFGFLYLALATGLCVVFFVWVRQPMWWDLEDPRARDLGEAEYLVRIASDGPEQKAGVWFGEALRLAVRQSEWGFAERVLATADEHGVEVNPKAFVPIEPGKCFAVGLDAERWTVGANPAALFLVNDSDAAMTVRGFCSCKRAAQGVVQDPGAPPQEFELDPGGGFSFERVVPAKGRLIVEVRALPQMFRVRETRSRGIRLDRLEVSP